MRQLSKAQPAGVDVASESFAEWDNQVRRYQTQDLIRPAGRDFGRRSLMFHCFPRLGTDWREVCWSTFCFRGVFNGRVLISIVSGPECERPEIVAEWFQQFGTVEIAITGNDPKAGINTTFRKQLRAIRGESGIVFKAHTKGISHITGGRDPFRSWRDNMARGCLSRIDHVEQMFGIGYRAYGAYKTFTAEGAEVMGQIRGALRTVWPGWHYPGAFYWFDPWHIPTAWFSLPVHYFENEAFPCHLCPTEWAYSLTPNNLNFQSATIDAYLQRLSGPVSP